MLTRLMRDYGYDFYWSDKYCSKLFAQGFEADNAGKPFAALTAFEVLEHIPNPLEFISDAMQTYGTRTLVFSTELYHGAPPPWDWNYYDFKNGQHISFYQARTMALVGEMLNLKFHSANGIHVLTDRSLSTAMFALLTGRFSHVVTELGRRLRPSYTLPDHHALLRD